MIDSTIFSSKEHVHLSSNKSILLAFIVKDLGIALQTPNSKHRTYKQKLSFKKTNIFIMVHSTIHNGTFYNVINHKQ